MTADAPRQPQIRLRDLPRLATIDERFQSYNVEMVEVIGGRFWKPYLEGRSSESDAATPAGGAGAPVGVDPDMYQYRPPIDLHDARLRALAGALGPAYVRVSGTWANTVYFHDSDDPPPSTPPVGFNGILTREQWRGVLEFAAAVDAHLVSSVATSTGVRDRDGRWMPEQAQRLLAYTRRCGGHLVASEFMNEPTYAAMGGAPEGYDAAWFGRDVRAFAEFLHDATPDTTLLGPGSVGEGGPTPLALGGAGVLASPDLLRETGPAFPLFSYHYYGAVSERGAGLTAPGGRTSADRALSRDWLTRTEAVHDYYAGLRDQFVPGASMWLTETAQAAAGGDRWASTFADTFRYVYQLGALARRGVRAVFHNTLASSDYGLLDENGYTPRPSYWAALLWRRLMGTTVLDPGPAPWENTYLFAHVHRDDPRQTVVLVLNTDPHRAHLVQLSQAVEQFTLSAKALSDSTVQLNGRDLTVGGDGALSGLRGSPQSGTVRLDPQTITFLVTTGLP